MLLEKALEVNTTVALANLSLARLGYDFKNKKFSLISGAEPVDTILVPICLRQPLIGQINVRYTVSEDFAQ